MAVVEFRLRQFDSLMALVNGDRPRPFPEPSVITLEAAPESEFEVEPIVALVPPGAERWQMEIPDDQPYAYAGTLGTADDPRAHGKLAAFRVLDGQVVEFRLGGEPLPVRAVRKFIIPDIVEAMQTLRSDLRDVADPAMVALGRTIEDLPLHALSFHDWRRSLTYIGDWAQLDIDENLRGGSARLSDLRVRDDVLEFDYDVVTSEPDKVWVSARARVEMRRHAVPSIVFSGTRSAVRNALRDLVTTVFEEWYVDLGQQVRAMWDTIGERVPDIAERWGPIFPSTERTGRPRLRVHQRLVETGLPGVTMSGPDGEWTEVDAFRPDMFLTWSNLRLNETMRTSLRDRGDPGALPRI